MPDENIDLTEEQMAANAAAAPKAPKRRKAKPTILEADAAIKKMAPVVKAAFAKTKAPAAQKPAKAPKAPAADKAPNKGDIVIAALRSKDGATLEDLQKATGWQAHSVRGFLAGSLKKKGHVTSNEKVEGRGRVYRLPAAARVEEAI